LEHFAAIWDILWPFGIFCGHLGHFAAIWDFVSGFGKFNTNKSGNPDCSPSSSSLCWSLRCTADLPMSTSGGWSDRPKSWLGHDKTHSRRLKNVFFSFFLGGGEIRTVYPQLTVTKRTLLLLFQFLPFFRSW
jgi:hypothetical protein